MSSDTQSSRQHGSSGDRTDSAASDADESSLDGLSPSSKLIYKVLEYEGELTQEELAAESRLCSRTVRYALRRLEDDGLVASRVHLEDARQSVYRIDD